MKRKALGRGLDSLLPKKKGKKKGKIHAAKIANSPRLQRVLKALRGGVSLSTREIIRIANVCAVNSCVDEIREAGYDIRCHRVANLWVYRMVV
jgi:hypothetical protein